MEEINLQTLQHIFNDDPGFVGSAGVRVTEAGPGRARGEIRLGPQHMNPIGTVHGGCIFTLADTVSAAAAFTYGQRNTTVSADIHFLNAAHTGTRALYADAKAIKHGKKITVVDVQITDDTDTLIASFSATFYALNQSV